MIVFFSFSFSWKCIHFCRNCTGFECEVNGRNDFKIPFYQALGYFDTQHLSWNECVCVPPFIALISRLCIIFFSFFFCFLNFLTIELSLFNSVLDSNDCFNDETINNRTAMFWIIFMKLWYIRERSKHASFGENETGAHSTASNDKWQIRIIYESGQADEFAASN